MIQLRPIIAGTVWGVLQTVILVWAFLLVGYANYGFFGDTLQAFAFSLLLGVSAVVGYSTKESDETVKALLVSLPVIFILTYGILTLPSLNEPMILVFLFSAGVLPFHFLLGGLAAFGGLFIGERFEARQRVPMDWKFVSVGLLANGTAVLWPIYPSIRTISDTLMIIVLVAAGLASTLVGLTRKRSISSERAGVLATTSLLLFTLTLISISYAIEIYLLSRSLPLQSYIVLGGEYLQLTWLLGLSLIASAGIFASCLYPQKIVDLRHRLESSKGIHPPISRASCARLGRRQGTHNRPVAPSEGELRYMTPHPPRLAKRRYSLSRRN